MADFSLTGRVALVTGSTKGLGLSMAVSLARAGARVAINYFNDSDAASRAAALVEKEGQKVHVVRADVTEPDQVGDMISRIENALGPVDILVPNATCDQPQKTIEEYDWAEYQTMIDFFIKSPFLLTQACVSHMKKQRWGRIINIGTECFVRGTPQFTAYVAAKGGQAGFTRSLASELAPFGITVNIISPGWIPVERHEKDPQEMKDEYLSGIPMQRWGVPLDIAGAVVFLAGDAASFLTGQNLTINGGISVA